MTTIRVIVLTSDIITERGCNNTSFISSTNLIITVGKSNTWGKILSILPKPYSFPGMFIMLEEKIKTVEDLKQLFTGQVNTIWCIKLVECPEVTQTANINEKLNFLVQLWPFFLATVVLHTRSSCAMRDCYLRLTSDSRYVRYSGQIIDLFTTLIILLSCFASEKWSLVSAAYK